MRNSRISVCEKQMERNEYLKRLNDKLIEEAKEVTESKTKEELRRWC